MVEAKRTCTDTVAIELTSLLTKVTGNKNLGFVISGSSHLEDLSFYLFPNGLTDYFSGINESLLRGFEEGDFYFPVIRVSMGDDNVTGRIYPTQEYAEAVVENDRRRYELSRLPFGKRKDAREESNALELRYPKYKIGVNELGNLLKSE